MPFDRGLSRARALLVASLACAAVLPAHAERWVAPGGAVTLDLPEGGRWTVFEVPPSALPSLPAGARVVARRTEDGDKGAMLIVHAGVTTPHVSDRLIEGLEKGLFQDSPLTKLSSGRVTIQGRPAYRALARLPNGAQAAGIVVIEAGVTYTVVVYKADGDPLLDPELASCLESIRLP